jgi:hypothetical protein
MSMRRSLAVFAFASILAAPLSAAWMQRYDAFPMSAPSGIAALPNGELVLVTTGHATGFDVSANEYVIAILDARGAVKSARKLERQVLALATGPGGEIFVGDSEDGLAGGVSTIFKLDREMSASWVRRITVEDQPVHVTRIYATADGGAIAACKDYASTFLIKLSSAGRVEWAQRLDAAGGEQFDTIQETRDGGFIAAGFSYGRAWLARLNADGTVLWQKHYGDRAASFRLAVETSRGNFLVAGAQAGQGTLLEVDARGTPLWSRITKTKSSVDAARPAAGGLAMSLISETEHILLVADERGEIRWQHALPYDALSGSEDGFAVAGGSIVFAAPVDREQMHTTVLRIDADGTAPACTLWSPANVAFEDFTIRVSDPFPVESGEVEATVHDASLRLEPFELASKPENCDGVRRDPRSRPSRDAPVATFKPNAEKPEFDARVKELFLAKRFGELEALAAEWRTKRSPDPLRPQRELRWIYSVFQDDTTAPASERIALLREWVAHDPKSVTARIALGSVLYEATADLRGSGFAASPTEAAREAQRKMWQESLAIFESIGSAGENDSEYWVMLLHLTAQSGGDAKEVTLRALQAIPAPIIATNAARYFHPDWGGSPEEFVAFMDAVARATQATHGDGLYAAMAWEIEGQTGTAHPNEYKVDWNRVWRGCGALIAMSPEWLPTYHRCAREAERKQNDEYANELLVRPELDWYEGAVEIWFDRPFYENKRNAARAWKAAQTAPRQPASQSPAPVARETRPEPPAFPFAGLPSEKWPRFIVAGEIKTAAGTTNVPFFFVSTGRNVVGISTISVLYRPREGWTREGALQSIQSWRATSSPKLVGARIPPVSDYQWSMSFELGANAKLPAEALVRTPTEPPMFGQVFVVACRWKGRECEQMVLRGERIGGANGNPPEKMRTLMIAFKEPVDGNALVGAAVVDPQGYVIGVVRNGEAGESPDWASMISADDITYFVE